MSQAASLWPLLDSCARSGLLDYRRSPPVGWCRCMSWRRPITQGRLAGPDGVPKIPRRLFRCRRRYGRSAHQRVSHCLGRWRGSDPNLNIDTRPPPPTARPAPTQRGSRLSDRTASALRPLRTRHAWTVEGEKSGQVFARKAVPAAGERSGAHARPGTGRRQIGIERTGHCRAFSRAAPSECATRRRSTGQDARRTSAGSFVILQ